MSNRGLRPLRNAIDRRRRRFLGTETEETVDHIPNTGAEETPKGVTGKAGQLPYSVASPEDGVQTSAPLKTFLEPIVHSNFPGDHDYTLNALVEELTLAERHLRDGSWKLCDCNPEKHLPMIAGLASEGYGFTDDMGEKAFMVQLRDGARIFKTKIEKGLFQQRDAEDLRAWTREMRHRISFKQWSGEMGETPELTLHKKVANPDDSEAGSREKGEDEGAAHKDFPDEEVPDYKYSGQLYLLTSKDCPKCEMMKREMSDVIEDGTVIPTLVDDDVGYDIVSKLQLRAVPTLVIRKPDGSYEEVTDESQLTG